MANMFSSFLHPERGYQAAQGQLSDYYNQGQGYLQPYMQQGQQAYGGLNNAMERLLNPEQLHNEWAQGYQQSPYAQMLQNRNMNSGLEAASSMGLMGSSPALQSIQAGSANISAADQQNYMDSLMQKYLQGAQLAQGIYGTGAQAGSQMGQNANQMGNNAAQLAYGQQNAPGELFGNLIGTAAGLGGSYMGMRGMNNMADAWRTGGINSGR